MSDDKEVIELRPYYVYVLMDSDQKDVFYVGKGQGGRIYHHGNEVKALLRNGFKPGNTKQNRIAEIISSGKDFDQHVIGRYESENEAFAVESTLINWVYGFDNLTNLNRGKNGSLIRPKGSVEEIPGVDVPKVVRSFDGSFKNEKIRGLVASEAYDFIDYIKSILIENGFQVRDFSLAEDRPYNPGESNGVLGFMVRISGIDFMVACTKALTLQVFIATTKSTEEVLSRLPEGQLDIGEPKNTKVKGVGRYRDLIQKEQYRFKKERAEHIIDSLKLLHTSLQQNISKF